MTPSHLPAPLQPLGISCLWDVRTTALPSLMMLTMVFHSMRRAWGSMPVVGSSCGEAEGRGLAYGTLHGRLPLSIISGRQCTSHSTVG